VESFFSAPVELDFRVSYAPSIVVAPRGGSSSAVEIKVIPK
jgi:hypothetical protein